MLVIELCDKFFDQNVFQLTSVFLCFRVHVGVIHFAFFPNKIERHWLLLHGKYILATTTNHGTQDW